MRWKLFFILMLAGALGASNYVRKADYDIDFLGLSKAASWLNYECYDDGYFEISLGNGGYFTLGTQSGSSASSLDDHCNITYGHPYARTSFPFLSVDGNWYKTEDFFADCYVKKSENILSICGTNDASIAYRFSLSLQPDHSITLTTTIINDDQVPHDFSSAMMIDPGIGKYGDGWIRTNGEIGAERRVFENSGSLEIWEKPTGARGLGVNISSEINFTKIVADNWPFAYKQMEPEMSDSEIQTIFDLLLKFYWPAQSVAVGDSLVNAMTITFPEADFSRAFFTRWDLPVFFDLVDGSMFPRTQSTYMEIIKGEESAPENVTISFDLPDKLQAEFENYNLDLSGKQALFQRIQINANIAYEDLVLPVKALVSADDEIQDEILRYIYLPETPVSDSGLTIYGDSLITSDFPEVSLVFNVENNLLGRKITDLSEENIFLYENETRINDFELGFFESDGSNLADIVFVMDCSGSMGNEIAAVKDNINDFAQRLLDKGYDFQVGVITFSTTVDDVWDFTNDLDQIKNNLSSVVLWGGVEDSPSALMRATELSWRDRSKRSIVWITDEAYPTTQYSKEQVVAKMLEMGITVHGVGLNSLQTDWFNPIVNPTGGNFYDINGNFKDILLDIANMGSEYKYMISYGSIFLENTQNDIYLKLRYNGLGCQSIFTYDVPSDGTLSKEVLTVYPNPFNERINFVLNLQDLSKTKMYIYNLLGKKIMEYTLPHSPGYHKIAWNGRDMQGHDVSTGMYIIQLAGIDGNGDKFMRTHKILYLK
ncbi:MAG: VWA domain-containing protein [Candidatus Marinimicrobia bacterium]|nr:VWA domain-containing protein [Candidatus Neomarinimicrobiota bacterium]